MWEILSISSIFIILGTFINSTITLRLILYFYPLKLFLISNIPDLKILNIGKKNMSYLLIIFSILQLTTWLAFANHAYCWVPYKNIIFSSQPNDSAQSSIVILIPSLKLILGLQPRSVNNRISNLFLDVPFGLDISHFISPSYFNS